MTQSLSFSAPAFADRVGLGLILLHDRAGFFRSTYLNFAYAYRMDFGEGKLGVGVQGSYLHHQADWQQARTTGSGIDQVIGDEAFTPVFNVGAGLHFESERFFAGVAVPHLLEKGLTEENAGISSNFTGTTPHLFVSAGWFVEVSEQVKLRPAFSARLVRHAPPGADVHLGVGFLEKQKLWLGGTYRWSLSDVPSVGDAAVLSAQFQVSERLRVGGAYDLTLNQLRQENAGTFEFMLEYCFRKKGAVAVRHPRFF